MPILDLCKSTDPKGSKRLNKHIHHGNNRRRNKQIYRNLKQNNKSDTK